MKTLALLPLILTLMAVPAVCQEPLTAPGVKATVTNIILFSDEGCARDFAKALRMGGGLEYRKYLFDLLQYRCIHLYSDTFYWNGLDRSQVSDGVDKFEIRKVHLISLDTAGEVDGWMFTKRIYDIKAITAILTTLTTGH
jgi:hypothetical protein